MNKVIFVGRLVRSVAMKSVGTNQKVVNNSIAVNRYQRDINGERIADFIPFVAWNHNAELLSSYCAKGDQIAIAGRMQSRSFVDKEDVTRYIVECQVEEITLIHRAGSTSETEKANEDDVPKLTEEELQDIAEAVDVTG